jgi:hypothetical protein
MECVLAEMKVGQKEMMAKMGTKMKADMKTQMAKIKIETIKPTKNIW